jgi:hypothetical protein
MHVGTRRGFKGYKRQSQIPDSDAGPIRLARARGSKRRVESSGLNGVSARSVALNGSAARVKTAEEVTSGRGVAG